MSPPMKDESTPSRGVLFPLLLGALLGMVPFLLARGVLLVRHQPLWEGASGKELSAALLQGMRFDLAVLLPPLLLLSALLLVLPRGWGGTRDCFRLDRLFTQAGFDRYLALEELGAKAGDQDGSWGAWDGFAAERFLREVAALPEPFCAVWATLTSHPPYRLPHPRYQVTPPFLPEAGLRDAMRYTDGVLGDLMERFARLPSFPRTVFLLVGDHGTGRGGMLPEEAHRVACLLYAPGRLPAGAVTAVGSQLDLLPTLLDAAGAGGVHHALGRSLLRPGTRTALLNLGDGYGWVDGEGLRILDGKGRLLEGGQDGVQDAHAFLQVTQELLSGNRFAPPYIPKERPMITSTVSSVSLSQRIPRSRVPPLGSL